MEAFTQFFTRILSQLSGANFALIAIIDFSAFGGVFLLSLITCALSPAFRANGRRGFLYAVNAFAAITLATFLIKFTAPQAIAVAAVFWLIGYALYGVLCLFKVSRPEPSSPSGQQTLSVDGQAARQPARQTAGSNPPVSAPAAQSAVRLDHALSIADKLLLKNLGRGDRQELEKIKTALTVLKVKGILSAQEGEALNEMFNALLKFMAKYDL